MSPQGTTSISRNRKVAGWIALTVVFAAWLPITGLVVDGKEAFLTTNGDGDFDWRFFGTTVLVSVASGYAILLAGWIIKNGARLALTTLAATLANKLSATIRNEVATTFRGELELRNEMARWETWRSIRRQAARPRTGTRAPRQLRHRTRQTA
jgi:hypothetical protein